MNPFLKQLTQTGDRKLIFIPFAGGYSASFRPLSKYFARTDWKVMAIEPSGHGSHRGPLLTDLNEIVDNYLEALLPELNTPFVFYGHSMGGLVTFLLTQRLEARGIFPETVFISGVHPPDVEREKHGHLPGPEFLEYVVSLGGIPKELLAEKELIDYYIPIFRADFQAIESYVHQNETLLQSPVHVFGGKEDDGNPPEKILCWSRWAPEAKFHWFEGGHMFLLDDPEAVTNRVLRIIGNQLVY